MKETTKQRRPGRPRSARSEEAILRVTLELLGKRGYRGVTINAVASRARVSKSTIYRRWKTKEELILAAFERTPPLELPDTGSVRRDLLSILGQFVELARNTPLANVLPSLVGECANNPSLMASLHPLIERRREPSRKALERGVERGEISAGLDLDVMVDVVVGPILLRLFFIEGDVSERALESIIDMALTGLSPRSVSVKGAPVTG